MANHECECCGAETTNEVRVCDACLLPQGAAAAEAAWAAALRREAGAS